MATHQSGHRPGGGIASKQHISIPVRTGSGSKSARPAGVSQIGYAVGDHTTNRPGSSGYRGERLHNPSKNFQPTKFGNEVALNVGKGGCGTGRTIYKTGSQGQQGGVAGTPRPTGRDILNNE
jgi:hypothetical protein